MPEMITSYLSAQSPKGPNEVRSGESTAMTLFCLKINTSARTLNRLFYVVGLKSLSAFIRPGGFPEYFSPLDEP